MTLHAPEEPFGCAANRFVGLWLANPPGLADVGGDIARTSDLACPSRRRRLVQLARLLLGPASPRALEPNRLPGPRALIPGEDQAKNLSSLSGSR